MFELRHQRTRHPHPGRTHPRPTPRLPTHRRAHPDHHHLNPNGAAVDRTNLTPSNKPAGHRHFPPPRPTQVRLNDRLSAVADRSAQVRGATGGHGPRVEPDSYVTRLIVVTTGFWLGSCRFCMVSLGRWACRWWYGIRGCSATTIRVVIRWIRCVGC